MSYYRDAASVVGVLQDDGAAVLIPASSAKVRELGDMDPPGPPLTQVVVHMLGRHLDATKLKHLTGTSV